MKTKYATNNYHSLFRFVKRFFRLLQLEIKRYQPIPHYIKYLREFDINTVLDIGANEGQSAKEFRKFFPKAIIHSFEPIKACYDILSKCSEEDDLLFPHNFALGNKTGLMQIRHNEHSPSSSLLKMTQNHIDAFPYTEKTVKEKIKVMRLDDIFDNLQIKENILMKIDVQGYEPNVIAGGEKNLEKILAIITEVSFVTLYEDQLLFDGLHELLKKFDFGYMGDVHKINDPNTGKPLQANALFIKKEFT